MNNNDHNLDDLIIDADEPTNNKAKSFLTIVALSIVVLIVAIILTKTLLKNAQDEALNFEQNYTDDIAPELKLEKDIEKDTQLAKIDDEKLSLSNIIADDDTKDDKDSVSKETIATIDESKPTTTKKVETNDAPAVYVPPVKKVAIPKSVYTQPVEQPKRDTPPPSSGNFYIKVGAFSNAPSNRFLSVITNNGFSYKITPPENGVKKLLIGPYSSRGSAQSALSSVQDRINKQAYVVEQ